MELLLIIIQVFISFYLYSALITQIFGSLNKLFEYKGRGSHDLVLGEWLGMNFCRLATLKSSTKLLLILLWQ